MTVRIHVTFWGVLHVTVTLSQRSTNQLSESWPARGQVQSFRSYVVGACKEDLICFFSGGPGVVQHDLFLPPKVAAVLSHTPMSTPARLGGTQAWKYNWWPCLLQLDMLRHVKSHGSLQMCLCDNVAVQPSDRSRFLKGRAPTMACFVDSLLWG